MFPAVFKAASVSEHPCPTSSDCSLEYISVRLRFRVRGLGNESSSNIDKGEIMNRIVITFVLSVSALTGCASLKPAELVTTPSASHSYVLRGQGSPSIVLEAGWGIGRESWSPVYKSLSETSQVLAYDRAGYGSSRSNNIDRDGATIVQELRDLLQSLKIAPPYVLVGHSLGGTYMELYARTYPEEVAGVVLVDSRHVDFTRQCLESGINICAPPRRIVAQMPVGLQREIESLKQTMESVLNTGNFPNVPLHVLTGSNNSQVGARFRSIWLNTQRELANLSNQSTHSVCNSCGHYVHHDNPTLVIDAIESIINQSRLEQH